MDPTIIVALIGAGATIIVALIANNAGKRAGATEGRAKGMWEGRASLQREIDDAPRKYVKHLESMILNAIQEGSEKARVNARAIVATRDDLRDSMVRIADRLNSEIDLLAEQSLKERPSELMDTMEVLAKKWPAKRDQVEIELRKVLAEMGLLGQAPAQPQSHASNRPSGGGGSSGSEGHSRQLSGGGRAATSGEPDIEYLGGGGASAGGATGK